MTCLKMFAGYRQVLKALPKASFTTDFNQLRNAQYLAHALVRLYVQGYCQSANDVLEKGHNCFKHHKEHPHVGIAAQAGLYKLVKASKSHQLEGNLVNVDSPIFIGYY
jgi:hypothetical protein